jgi:putative ABC transport system substrate-binding protein
MATVGVLTPGLTYEASLEGLRGGLEKLGYREGKEIRFLVEDSKGAVPVLNSMAAKLVDARPEVIFTVGTVSAFAAERATSAIPIVFSSVGDPIHTGLAASFASSGNNLTGISSESAILAGKRIELLKELAPKSKSVLVIVSAKETISKIAAQYMDTAAKKLGVRLVQRDLADPEDLGELFREKWAELADAVSPVPSTILAPRMEGLIRKATQEKLPLLVHQDALVKLGALAAYGGGRRLFGIQAAMLIGKILRGAKPADLPIETPDRFILSVNLAAAKAIDLKIPRAVLERVDRFVE